MDLDNYKPQKVVSNTSVNATKTWLRKNEDLLKEQPQEIRWLNMKDSVVDTTFVTYGEDGKVESVELVESEKVNDAETEFMTGGMKLEKHMPKQSGGNSWVSDWVYNWGGYAVLPYFGYEYPEYPAYMMNPYLSLPFLKDEDKSITVNLEFPSDKILGKKNNAPVFGDEGFAAADFEAPLNAPPRKLAVKNLVEKQLKEGFDKKIMSKNSRCRKCIKKLNSVTFNHGAVNATNMQFNVTFNITYSIKYIMPLTYTSKKKLNLKTELEPFLTGINWETAS